LPFHHVLSDPAVAVTRTVTVAAGRCAPGNLGELTAVVPLELVDAVPEETRSVQRRPRDLPSRDGVYLLLAMCLFPEVGAMTLVATPILAEQSCRSRVPVLSTHARRACSSTWRRPTGRCLGDDAWLRERVSGFLYGARYDALGAWPTPPP
jgi:hypothetical protein